MDRDNSQDLKIKDLENNQQFMAEKIDDLKLTVVSGFSDIKRELKAQRDCHAEDLKSIRIENEGKYASKLTETIVYGLVGLIVFTVFGAILTLVINSSSL